MGIQLLQRDRFQRQVALAQKKAEEAQKIMERSFREAPSMNTGLYSDELETMKSDASDAWAQINGILKGLYTGRWKR